MKVFAPEDITPTQQANTIVNNEMFDAVKVVLDHLKKTNGLCVHVGGKLLYRNEDSWHIDDNERQPIISMPSLKEAAIYFVLLNTPQVVIDELDEEVPITIEA